VCTNYENKYLGDPSFAPLWSELDRRGAIVFTHPTDAGCCPNPVPQMTETVVEFGADTARTIGSLLFSGTATRFPHIRFVFSHGGGSMPFAIDRFLNQSRLPKTAALLPNGVEYELRRFYYDTAFASSPVAMAALTKLVPCSQIVLGTDFPYSRGATTVAALNASGVASSDITAILRENGLALLQGPAR
jgi:6-methylsalicylate decarboxylase